MKVDLPSFSGKFDIETFLDWTKEVEAFFDYTNIPEDKKVKLVAYKLKGGTSPYGGIKCKSMGKSNRKDIKILN